MHVDYGVIKKRVSQRRVQNSHITAVYTVCVRCIPCYEVQRLDH